MSQDKTNWKRVELGLKRLESCVEISLNRLQQHKKNIILYEKDGDRSSVNAELKKAKHVISEINRNVSTSKPLRRQLSDDCHHLFDTKLSAINQNAQEKISEFKQVDPVLVEFLGEDFKQTLESGSYLTQETLENEITPVQQQLSQTTLHLESELAVEEDTTQQTEQIESNIRDLSECMQQLHTAVTEQKDQVDSIENNIQTAHSNIKEGGLQLNKATVLQAALWPVIGAGVGALLGGPIGLAAGLKIGLVAAGAGSITGGLVGKKIKESKNAAAEIELQNLHAASDTAETRKIRSSLSADTSTDASHARFSSS